MENKTESFDKPDEKKSRMEKEEVFSLPSL